MGREPARKPHNVFAVVLERWIVAPGEEGMLLPQEKIGSLAVWHDTLEEAFAAFEALNLRELWMALGYRDLGFFAKVVKIVEQKPQENLAEKVFTFDDYTWGLLMEKFHREDPTPPQRD